MQAQAYPTKERIPSLQALLAMPKAERKQWMRRAAELAASQYENNPALTETAETIDLYEHPDTPAR
jgi:hypothetical protein